MMLDKHIKEIIEAAGDRSPIWYGSIVYRILIKRKWIEFTATKIVMKGTEAEILKDKMTIRRVLTQYCGDKKKAHKFDLNKIKLHKCTFNKSLGYGIKC